MLKKIAPPTHRARDAEGYFRPAPQGRLEKALAKPGKLSSVSPNSPRPAEMLEGVVIDRGAASMTADDSALHELLVSAAYEADPSMPSGMVHALPMSHVLHFLGPNARRDTVKESLRRLMATTVSYGTKAKRRYEQVPLLTSWTETSEDEDLVAFTLPEPICILMRSQPRYAYIELAAVSAMRCSYSSRLYRVLALEAARTKWTPGGDNTVTVSATPSDLADWVGFPRRADGTVAYGKLKERLIRFLDADDKEEDSAGDLDAVRRFSTEIREVRKPGRGREVERVEFVLTVRPPSYHMVRMRFDPRDDIARIGGRDAKDYRVNSHIWRRAAKEFGRRLGMLHGGIFELWTIALNEAVEGVPLSDGYHEREFRGSRLLDVLRVHGADFAAWGFVTEEASAPDLADYYLNSVGGGQRRRAEAAEEARLGRLGIEKKPVRPAPAFLDDEAVPAAEASLPETEPAVPAATFETCREIVLPVDEGLGLVEMDGSLGAPIRRRQWTGTRMVKLTLSFKNRGQPDRWELGSFPMSEDDIDGILKDYWKYLDGVEEYVA